MSSKLYYDAERREAKRNRAKLVMKCKIIGQNEALVNTITTEDISSKGVSFESSDFIPIETRIDAQIIIPTISHPIKAKGRINRIEEIEKEKLCFYSMVFEEISQEDRYALEKYVQLIGIDNLLRLAVKKNASDIHLVANQPPVFRIEGELIHSDFLPISAGELKNMILSMLTEEQKEIFEKNLELDLSYFIPEGSRFRVSIYLEKGNLEAACRIIPTKIKTISELGLPPVVEKLTRLRKGLIIVSGPAGSGKTTTQAAMIDQINRERSVVIVSIEDPIEYIHSFKKSIIKQREVGSDTLSFANALKHILRQDPNVILVGEMRDLESISIAITAAETGHLILATLHTPNAVECINRIVDAYPAEQQNQIYAQLASCLEGIIAQLLIPKKDGTGRVLATEVLIPTPAIRNLIRNGKLEQIRSYIETGTEYSMHAMDSSLLKLVNDGIIDKTLAMGFAYDQRLFRDAI